MNTKQTEALKLARDFISAEWGFGGTTDIEPSKIVRMLEEALAEQPAQQQNPSEPIEFLSGFLTERLAIERGIEWTPAIHDLCNRAIEEEKLAEQPAQQEPVAWMFQHEETGRTMCVDAQQVEWGFEKGNPRLKKIAPLYTSPPASKPWVGLTDEDIQQVRENYGITHHAIKTIEAAHGIKEQQ